MDTPRATDFIDRLIADAPHVHWLECEDGSPPQLVFAYRPLTEGVAALFRGAIHNCKPVPTVLGKRTASRLPTATR